MRPPGVLVLLSAVVAIGVLVAARLWRDTAFGRRLTVAVVVLILLIGAVSALSHNEQRGPIFTGLIPIPTSRYVTITYKGDYYTITDQVVLDAADVVNEVDRPPVRAIPEAPRVKVSPASVLNAVTSAFGHAGWRQSDSVQASIAFERRWHKRDTFGSLQLQKDTDIPLPLPAVEPSPSVEALLYPARDSEIQLRTPVWMVVDTDPPNRAAAREPHGREELRIPISMTSSRALSGSRLSGLNLHVLSPFTRHEPLRHLAAFTAAMVGRHRVCPSTNRRLRRS